MRSKLRILQLLVVALVLICAVAAVGATPPDGTAMHYRYAIQSTGCCTLIAHAGGSIDGNPYTNSRQALLLSIRNGYRYVEMDFSQTAQGDWFTVHNWDGWALDSGYKGPLPPSTKDVVKLKDHFSVARKTFSIPGTYSVMSLEDLLGILAKHPSVHIITDTKSDTETQRLIDALQRRPEFNQFVFQAYSINGLQAAAARVPQNQLILTTYLMRDWYAPDGFGPKLLGQIEKYPHLFALTVPFFTASEHDTMRRIKQALSIPILVHGKPKRINSRNLHLQLADWGVNGIYVD